MQVYLYKYMYVFLTSAGKRQGWGFGVHLKHRFICLDIDNNNYMHPIASYVLPCKWSTVMIESIAGRSYVSDFRKH
jgi:hypothetical protein